MRINADSISQMLAGSEVSGAPTGVRGAMIGGEEAVILASRNLAYNADLTLFDAEGQPEGMELVSQPAPDGWNAYLKQLTRIGSGGGHVPLRGRNRAKQNLSTLSLNEGKFVADRMIPGEPPPVRGGAQLAPPSEPVRVRVVNKGGPEGFPAGDYYGSIAGIVGNPKTSTRITDGGPLFSFSLSQGEYPVIVLPTDIDASFSGLAISISRPAQGAEPNIDSMRICHRLSIVRRIPEEVPVRGPFATGVFGVYPGSENRTYIGGFEEYPAPRVWTGYSPMKASRINTVVGYEVRTSEGRSALQRMRRGRVAPKGNTALCIAPPAGALGEWVTAWRPVFEGLDRELYTIELAKNNYYGGWYPPSRVARLNTADTSKKNWRGEGRPVRIGRHRDDLTGLSAPDISIEEVYPQGEVTLPPGRYEVATNFAYENDSSPVGPHDVVNLPDTGVRGGGAPTGVTDKAIEFRKPGPQAIADARFSEDGTLDWEAYEPPTVSIESSGGILYVSDTSGLTSIDPLRRSRPVRIRHNRRHTLRARIVVSRADSGAGGLAVAFLDENLDQLDSARVLTVASGVEWANVDIGPEGTREDVHYPPATEYLQIMPVGVGAAGPRDIDWTLSYVGLSYGPAHNRKRWPLSLALHTDTKDSRTDEERAELPYPVGPYTRVVVDPPEEALPSKGARRPLAHEGFEGEPVFSYTNLQIMEEAAIFSSYGAKTRSVSAEPSYASFTPPGFPADRVAVRRYARIRNLPSEGQVRLLGILSETAELARFALDSEGTLSVVHTDASQEHTTILARHITSPNTLRLELIISGVGTQQGRVEARSSKTAKLDPQRLTWAEFTDLDLRGQSISEVRAGTWGATGSYDMDLDAIAVTEDGDGAREALRGNFIESYQPEGSPYLTDAPVSGYRQRLTSPGERHVASVYAGCEGTEDFRVGSLILLDEDGVVVAERPPMATLRGNHYWDRYYTSFDTPPEAAWVEWRGGFREGLIRMGFFQVELDDGSRVPSEFTTQTSGEGTVPLLLDTSIPLGKPFDGIVSDRLEERNLEVRETHDESEDEQPITGVEVLSRSSSGVFSLGAESYSSELANAGRYVDVLLKLTRDASYPSATPAIRGLALTGRRLHPVLLKEDGSEYPGSVIADNVGALHESPLIVERERATGAKDYHEPYPSELGFDPPERLYDVSLFAWTDEAVEELSGVKRHMIESYGRRYVIEAPPPVFEVDRSVRRKVNGQTYNSLFTATIEEAEVLSWEEIGGEILGDEA